MDVLRMLRTLLRKTVSFTLKDGHLKTFDAILRQNYGSGFPNPLNKIFSSSRTCLPTKGHTRSKNGMSSPSVKHNKRDEYFYIETPECKAILEYERRKEVVTILSTEVPKMCGGQGYGKQLAEAALEWIAKNNLRMIIECEFVEKYVEKHRPEFKKYLQK